MIPPAELYIRNIIVDGSIVTNNCQRNNWNSFHERSSFETTLYANLKIPSSRFDFATRGNLDIGHDLASIQELTGQAATHHPEGCSRDVNYAAL